MLLLDSAYGRGTSSLAPLFKAANNLQRSIDDQQHKFRRIEEQIARARQEFGVFRDRQAKVRRTESERTQAAFKELRDRLRRQIAWAQRANRQEERLAGWRSQEAVVLDRLGRLARTDELIVVGPWAGEVGFELLYWIPFVRWATSKFGLDPSRLVVVSRGGTKPWYDQLAEHYIDLFDFLTLDEFRSVVQAAPKQRSVHGLDRALLRRVRQRLGVSRVRLLHPSLMYELFYPIWKGQASLQRLDSFTMYAPPGQAERPVALDRLPSSYVAARFYFSGCFPETVENRRLVVSTLRSLTEETDVVLLNPGFRLDDHHDSPVDFKARTHGIDDIVSPEDNLSVQTAVIQGASGFVGTYGGFSYLAPLCGVDAVGLFSVHNFFVQHLEVALQAFDRIDGGRLTTVDLAAVPLISKLFASGSTGQG